VMRRMIGLDPGRRLNVAQRSSHSPKAVWRSWDRGCKGHRILRRVLVGGRHLRTSRALGFHESVVTATLAASSRGQRRERDSSEKSWRRAPEGRAKALPVSRKRERRQGCQRLGRSRRRGKKTPTLSSSHPGHGEVRARGKTGSVCLAPIRRSVLERREALGPSIKSHEAQDFVPRASGAFQKKVTSTR
jgi:hypothetical protein